jgi:hypothetical protein
VKIDRFQEQVALIIQRYLDTLETADRSRSVGMHAKSKRPGIAHGVEVAAKQPSTIGCSWPYRDRAAHRTQLSLHRLTPTRRHALTTVLSTRRLHGLCMAQ